MPVTKWVGDRVVNIRTPCRDKLESMVHDCSPRAPDQSRCTPRNRLGPFGRVTQDENRFSEGRGLLLDSAGVCEDDICPPHQPYERKVIKRWYQVNIGVAAQPLVYCASDRWVGMHR